MKIHNKLFFILISFSFLLVGTLVLLVQWSIDKGMVDYVNTRELNTLKPLVDDLAIIYQREQSWGSLQGEHRKFQHMLAQQLSGSDFSHPREEVERRRAPRNRDGFSEHKRPKRFEPPPPRHTRLQERRPKERPAKQGASRAPRERDFRMPPPPRGGVPPRHNVSYALLDKEKHLIVGNYPQDNDYVYSDIIVDKETVGYFAVSKRNKLTQGYELDFIEQQKHYLWFAAIVVMLLVALVTMPLARHLVDPIRQLTRAVYRLTQGEYKQSLNHQRKDEFGQLNRDVNELAQTLETNETARKRWLANISHELRTPIAILRGELEAMLDGVRDINNENILSASHEVLHLQRLVEDLHQLTSADIGGMSYRKSEFDLAKLLQQESGKYSSYLAHVGGTFDCCTPDRKVSVFADNTRICQLLDNLVNNCVKYAGDNCLVKLSLSVNRAKKIAEITVEDNGVGVDEKHYAHLFEHLYRVDDSRNRSTGGTGLGLSICAHIVDAHQGKIIAKQSTLGGLAVIISLPLI